MPDIRQEVLQFARASIGKRIWARIRTTRRTRVNGRTQTVFSAPTDTYTWRGEREQCTVATSRWEQNNNVILSDRDRRNNFRGEDRVAHRECGIGYGECWDLAYAALAQHDGLHIRLANNRTLRVWSDTQASALNQIRGGEILELANYYCVTLSESGGQYRINSLIINFEHTAIISGRANNGIVPVIQQNFSGNRLVHSSQIPIATASYRSNGRIIHQACGGSTVRALARRSNNLNGNNNSFMNLARDIKSYVRAHNLSIPEQVDIYIPKSES